MNALRWLALAMSVAALARAEGTMDSPMAKLFAQVDALRTTSDTWRRIPWRTCLLSAAREAREKGRPMLVWALGGDPSGRC